MTSKVQLLRAAFKKMASLSNTVLGVCHCGPETEVLCSEIMRPGQLFSLFQWNSASSGLLYTGVFPLYACVTSM